MKNKIKEQIKETKENSAYVELELLGSGSDKDPFRPNLKGLEGCYIHIDWNDVDYAKKTVKVYFNTIKSTHDSKIALKRMCDNPEKKHKLLHIKSKNKELLNWQ